MSLGSLPGQLTLGLGYVRGKGTRRLVARQDACPWADLAADPIALVRT